jgi:hypothetical protein
MNKQLKFNICQVAVPSEDQYQDLDNLLQKGLRTDHMSEELQYAMCFWANHLGKVKEMDSKIEALLEGFSKCHLIHWLEALAWIKKLDIAHTTLRMAVEILVCQFYIKIIDCPLKSFIIIAKP